MGKQDITAAILPAYRDDALDPQTMELVRDRLATDPALRNAYEALLAQEDALYDLGNALRDAAPAVYLRDVVMERLDGVAAEADPLQNALLHLGGDLRTNAPPLDIAAAVMNALPALPVMEQELIATGAEIRAHAPRVDVVEEVMDEVVSGHLDTVVPFPAEQRKGPPRRESPFSWQLIVAAAACLLAVVSVVVMQMTQPSALRNTEIAGRALPAAQSLRRTSDAPTIKEGEPLGFIPASSDQRISLLSSALRPAASPEPEEGDSSNQEEARPSLAIEDIIAARRDALNGQSDALALLARWGALDPDEIRRLLAEGLISSTELAGLSRFLPEDEARALLEQALEQNPDDPLLRFALARHLMNDPERYNEALQQLALFRGLAPDNSLSYYMDAQIRLAQGDYAGAMQSLEYAAAFQSGSTYALQNAQHHSAALQAAGMPSDMAQMLAAFNAGTDEYGSVTQLGYDLISYGAYFESIGDYDTALAIYKGVHQLGLQLNQGANFANEMLAGLDTQMVAIEALNALAQMMEIPGGAYTIEIAYTVFMEGLDFFLDYTNVFENLLGGPDTENVMRTISQIMRLGDIRFFGMP